MSIEDNLSTDTSPPPQVVVGVWGRWGSQWIQWGVDHWEDLWPQSPHDLYGVTFHKSQSDHLLILGIFFTTTVPFLYIYSQTIPWQMTPTSLPWWQSRCPILPVLHCVKLDSVPLQCMPPKTGPLPSPKEAANTPTVTVKANVKTLLRILYLHYVGTNITAS